MRIDSWVMVCTRLRVVYTGYVCGGTLGDGAAAVCSGTATTLGAAGAGWQGWWSDCGEVALP